MTSLRALLAVLLLAGFFLLALGIVAGLFTAAVLVGHHAGGRLAALAVVVTVGVGRALWQVFRQQSAPPEGVRIAEHQAPELFDTVRRMAAQVGTRVPDEIRLIPQVNAAVAEDTRWLGLSAGTRWMYIGVPLLMAFDVDQLRAVLAHELGHYSHSHTRLGEITYQGRVTIIRTALNIGHRSVVGYLFRGYLWLYLLVSSAVSRRQELEADRAAVQIAGRAATASALREVHVLDAAWDYFLASYVMDGYQRGYFPAGLFAGFAELVSGRSDELARIRRAEPTGQASRWDSHPALAERLAAIGRAPDRPSAPDRRPAAVLVPDLGAACREVEATAFEVGSRRVVPWPEFTAAAVTGAYQENADALYRSAARVAGRDRGDLGLVLDLLATGRLDALAADLTKVDPADERRRQAGRSTVAAELTHAVQLAAVRSGIGWWRHSWTGPVAVVGADGRPLDFGGPITAAVADTSAVPALRTAFARLGVNEAAAVAVETRTTGATAAFAAGLSGIKFDGQFCDLFILDEGLVFVPAPQSAGGEQRLRALLASIPVGELAARNRWLPYQDISEVTLKRKVPLRYELRLTDGSLHALNVGLRSEPLGEGHKTLARVLASFLRRSTVDG